MNEAVDQTFWERLAARTRASGALLTIEDPMTIVRLLTGTLLGAAAITGFGGLFMALLDESAVGLAYLVLAALYLVAWVSYGKTGSTRGAILIVLWGSAAVVLFAHISLGGYANSGGQLLWAITLTMGSALFLSRAWTVAAAAYFIGIGITMGFLEQSLAVSRPAPDPTLPAALFPQVLVGSVVVLAPIFVYVLGRLSRERARAEALLLNVLPGEVAAELKQTGSTTARRFDQVSVLFADIVGFTPWSATMEPEEMVSQLNEVFTYFDTLAERYQVEKIRTMGDAYMVAAGVPVPREDHAKALAAMALDMIAYAEQGPLSFRIGINSGHAVAGVIGTRKFQYDIWGDTINTAERMESHGKAGRIQITDATYQLIKDSFATTLRGPIEVKGKGTVTTWWLDAEKAAVRTD